MKISYLASLTLSLIRITPSSSSSLNPFRVRLYSTRDPRRDLSIFTSSTGEIGTLDFQLKYKEIEKKKRESVKKSDESEESSESEEESEKEREISPWHDIPLRNNTDFNFITEVPFFFFLPILVSCCSSPLCFLSLFFFSSIKQSTNQSIDQ